MFNNIGGKIKTVAKVFCWIGIIASVIGGIMIILQFTEIQGVVMGILAAALGILLSWISSFVLYGFGQLVENSDILVQNTKK